MTGKPVQPGNEALGSRRYDAVLKDVGLEGNLTPWSKLNPEELTEKINFKLKQVGSDILMINNPASPIRKVIWFGVEELPQTGKGAELLEVLNKAGIPYWVIK